MTSWQDVAVTALQEVGKLAVLGVGILIIKAGSEAPDRGSLPAIFEEGDLTQIQGILRMRQVLLYLGGLIIVAIGIYRLG